MNDVKILFRSNILNIFAFVVCLLANVNINGGCCCNKSSSSPIVPSQRGNGSRNGDPAKSTRDYQDKIDFNAITATNADIIKTICRGNPSAAFPENVIGCGMVNINKKICYMISVLQCLARTKGLYGEILQKDNYATFESHKNSFPLTIAISNVFKGLFDASKANVSYSPHEFIKIMGDKNAMFNGNDAADAKDLFTNLLQELQKELNYAEKRNDIGYNEDEHDYKKTIENTIKDCTNQSISIVSNCFYHLFATKTYCYNCKETTYSSQYGDHIDFPLRVVSDTYGTCNINIDSCLNWYHKQTFFKDFFCNRCRKQGVYQKTHLVSTPGALVFVLDRGKNLCDDVANFNLEESIRIRTTDKNNNTKTENYELYGVVTHFGASGRCAHFVAFCKCFDNNWYIFNDENVKQITFREVHQINNKNCGKFSEKNVDGVDYLYTNGKPYILFYQKKN